MSSSKKVIITKPIIIRKSKFLLPKQTDDDVIYQSSNCDFLQGESQQVLIVNKVNKALKTCRTVAKCTARGVCVETTSDDVCALIGQDNYHTVLAALGSAFDEKTRVRGILALLKRRTEYCTVSTQTDMDTCIKRECVDSGCQTLESSLDVYVKQKPRKRIRRQQLTPYVVKDVGNNSVCRPGVKKCIINIEDIIKKEDIKEEVEVKQCNQKEKAPELMDLKTYVDEDSIISNGSIRSMSSISCSIPDLAEPHRAEETLSALDQIYSNIYIKVYDGTSIMVPVKPKDDFHIATPYILRNVTNEDRRKLLNHQALVHFKMCLQRDERGFLPLHMAVLNSDVELVRRQCLALLARRDSVDRPVEGAEPADNMTALQMSISHNSSVECTRELLRRGADPLLGDAEQQTPLHLAADAADVSHLQALLDHCDNHPRQVLQKDPERWKPEYENMSDKELAACLYDKIAVLFDERGLSPLMVSAGAGRAAAAALLGARAPRRVDAASPACGGSALYRAVAAAACLHAKDTGNRTTVPEHFLQIAEMLVGHGADPSLANNSGSSVDSLLQEYNIPPLSMAIANKMSAMKHGKLNSMILTKDKDGRIAPEIPKTRNYKSVCNSNNSVDIAVKMDDIKASISKRKQDAVDIVANKHFKHSVSVSETKGVQNLSDKIKCILATPGRKTNEASKRNTSKIVIVENVPVKTDFTKMNIPSAAAIYTRPKDIVLVPAKKDSPKYVKIAPKAMKHVGIFKSKTDSGGKGQ